VLHAEEEEEEEEEEQICHIALMFLLSILDNTKIGEMQVTYKSRHLRPTACKQARRLCC